MIKFMNSPVNFAMLTGCVFTSAFLDGVRDHYREKKIKESFDRVGSRLNTEYIRSRKEWNDISEKGWNLLHRVEEVEKKQAEMEKKLQAKVDDGISDELREKIEMKDKFQK